MDLTRVTRAFRITTSVVFGIACVLSIVLWVRCYWRIDTLWGQITGRGQLAFVSMQGQLFVGANKSGGGSLGP